jgi:hypothetical protein
MNKLAAPSVPDQPSARDFIPLTSKVRVGRRPRFFELFAKED